MMNREAEAAVEHSGQSAEGVWQIKAKPFGGSTSSPSEITGKRNYQIPVKSRDSISLPPNLPSPFNWDFNGMTYEILLRYRLYIAHDDVDTDSSFVFKGSAKNVAWICFREEVFHKNWTTGKYVKAPQNLVASLFPNGPTETETKILMTKAIDANDGSVTTVSRSEDFVAADESLFVSWVNDAEGNPTDQFEVTFNHPRINIASHLGEVNFITRRKQQ